MITRTDDGTGLGLAVTDVVEQRDIGGAGELAGSTFDAVHDVVLFRLVEIVLLGHFVKQERLQTHGAGHGATTATDAVGLSAVLGFLEGHQQNA